MNYQEAADEALRAIQRKDEQTITFLLDCARDAQDNGEADADDLEEALSIVLCAFGQPEHDDMMRDGIAWLQQIKSA